ncbi:TetR-like C-terminal domain-containing protein [Nocardioides sp. B-3]|uniref:TetR-like C-terminal domain-containing protein n=1 Tax=Nocardioides sp. B-3 TaxID=2895565 RepID=UPI0021520B13|nr:TetR-like C-terminal domain-containing protein [Nocardioides sp. B-3]UUZ59985.1 TetR/AcrR family transcriptional regulator C-terminal ligand-binding domain-containing protein [Nocardioides sp. B-3]
MKRTCSIGIFGLLSCLGTKQFRFITTGGTTTMNAPDPQATRPRIEGDREQEILQATLDVLAEVGYDRLTMDAVASAAKASKATLYRRWNGKVSPVIDALLSQKQPSEVPDTGTLRGDLIAAYCGMGGFGDARAVSTFTSVLTAMVRDEEFAEAYRRDVLGPKVAASSAIYARALERGELGEGADVSVPAPALAGIVMHRFFLHGEEPNEERIARIIDQIIIPAATCPHLPTASDQTPHELTDEELHD